MTSTSKSDILIVGAGPTGMILAIELARRGINFRMIEKRKEPTTMSRAFTLHAKTMEMLEHMGIAHHFLNVGIKSRGFYFSFQVKDAHPTLDFTKLDTDYPYVLVYDQSETDKHLREHLDMTYDVRPEWSTELIELKQDGERCRAVLRRADSSEEEIIEPTWVVGCDGVNSFVRTAADLDFTGSKYEGIIMQMMDTSAEGFEGSDDWVHYYISREKFLLVTKMPSGYHRLGVSGMGEAEDPNQTRRELFQNLIDQHVEGTTLAEPVLERKWEVRRRIASDYRNGNIFLAGDAAHVHSPSGGQGMNVGMQDAFNLGWKLALVASGKAQRKLLDTYSLERMPIGKQVLAGTDAMHDIIMAHGRGMEDRMQLTQTDGWHNNTVSLISGLSYNYRDAISLAPELKLDNGILPGNRAPNVSLQGETRLLDILRHPRMTLLIAAQKDADNRAMEEIAAVVSARFGESIQVSVTEESEEFASRYGTYDQPHIYLIRPDGYVFCHCLLTDASLLLDYLSDWLCPASS